MAHTMSLTCFQLMLCVCLPSFASSTLIEASSSVDASSVDALWLRFPLVADRARLFTYKSLIRSVMVNGADLTSSSVAQVQLQTSADELSASLGSLLGRKTPSRCCAGATPSPHGGDLQVTVNSSFETDLGKEGFRIGRHSAGKLTTPTIKYMSNLHVPLTATSAGVTLDAATPSGALYGVYHFLGYLQRAEPIPESYRSSPAMHLRIWDLWDETSGSVTRGFAGRSLLWPMALFDDDKPPPRERLYLRECNSSDPWQQWQGDTLASTAGATVTSTIRNKASRTCLTTVNNDPLLGGPCDGPASALFLFNPLNGTLAVQKASSTGAKKEGSCLDINGGRGPDVDLYACHTTANPDYRHQEFRVAPLIAGSGDSFTLEYVSLHQCLSLERDSPPPEGTYGRGPDVDLIF